MESVFGQNLSWLRVALGARGPLGGVGARAAAGPGVVAFSSTRPGPSEVAHEVAHALQHRGGAEVRSHAREAVAEREARAAARHVEAGGAGRLSVTAVPGAPVLFWSPEELQTEAPDPVADAYALRDAYHDNLPSMAMPILARNARPLDMYRLHQVYGESFVADIYHFLADTASWPQVRIYLGNQLPLHLRISTRGGDREGILRDLQRLPDQEALDLFTEPEPGFVVLGPAVPDPTPFNVPATPTTRAAVVEALHSALDADGYFQAMSLLLDKAGRAARRQAATQPVPIAESAGTLVISALPGSRDLSGVGPLGFEELPALDDPASSELVPVGSLQRQRAELALGRIRRADASDWDEHPEAEGQALLALTNLGTVERRILLHDLLGQPLRNDATLIERVDRIPDQATLLQQAMLEAARRSDQLDEIGMATAAEEAQTLIARARGALDALPPDASEADRAAAEAEVARVEGLLSGGELLDEMDDQGRAVDWLSAVGADPVTLGAARLNQVMAFDVDGLIETLQQIPPSARLPALDRSLVSWWIERTRITDEHRDLLAALLLVGLPPSPPLSLEGVDLDLSGTGAGEPPTAGGMVPVSPQPTVAFRLIPLLPAGLYVDNPRVVLAAHEVLTALDQDRVSAALSVIQQLGEEDRRALYQEARFRARVEGTDPDSDLGEALRDAAWNPQVAMAVYAENAGDRSAALEWVALRVGEFGGQAEMRRGYVLQNRREANPALELTEREQAAIDHYQSVIAGYRHVMGEDQGEDGGGWQDREALDEIMLGQPQLIDSAAATVDPTLEADFMFQRLTARADRASPEALEGARHAEGDELDEAVTDFSTYYRLVRPAGVSRGELAQLAEKFHRALDLLDSYQREVDRRRSEASTWSMLVGAVVAVVVTVATAGTMAPVAVAALAALGSGVGAAVTGAAIRVDSSLGDVATDFGTGAVEGALGVAGGELASAVVGEAAVGVPAAEAAAEAGEQAVARSAGIGSVIAREAIAGAVSGGGGQLFQTALDRATWDRGVAHAFATLLAALARGAVQGAAIGGITGGALHGLGAAYRALARRASPEVADGVRRLLRSSGVGEGALEHLSEATQDSLAQVERHVRAGELDEADQLIRRLEELPGASRRLLRETARARVVVQTARELGPLPEQAAGLTPEVMPDRAFRRLAGTRRGDALVVIRDGEPHMIVREGAPASVIREELVHVHQFYGDPAMRARMLRLGEESLAGWSQMSDAQRVALLADKLEVEADAQRRIIAALESRAAGGDVEAAHRVADAEETLFNLGERIDQVGAVRRGEAEVASLGLSEAEPPRLFGKGAQTPAGGPRGRRVAAARRLIREGASVNDAGVQRRLRRMGYILHRQGGEGAVFRLTRPPGSEGRLLALSVDEETGAIIEGTRASFGERLEDAARVWRRDQELLERVGGAGASSEAVSAADEAAAIAVRQRTGTQFRAELAARVERGELTEAGAGMLSRWGGAVDELVKRSAGTSRAVTMAEILADVPAGQLREVAADQFRRALRQRTVSWLQSIDSAAERAATMREFVQLQPDSGSMGELFTAFRRAEMGRVADEAEEAAEAGAPIFEDFGERPPPFEGPTLSRRRQLDDAATLADSGDLELPPGRYGIEDKTGPNAFDLEQARDYARMHGEELQHGGDLAPGFRQSAGSDNSAYDGILYIFSDEGHAERALERLRAEDLTEPLVGQSRGGIHVAYFDEAGKLTLANRVLPPP